MDTSYLIKASGKTREQICAEAQISRGMLSLIERGERRIGVQSVAKLAAALGVDPADLRPDLAALFNRKGAAQ